MYNDDFVSSFSQPITGICNFLKNYARSQNLMNATAAEINDSNLSLKIELEYLNDIKWKCIELMVSCGG